MVDSPSECFIAGFRARRLAFAWLEIPTKGLLGPLLEKMEGSSALPTPNLFFDGSACMKTQYLGTEGFNGLRRSEQRVGFPVMKISSARRAKVPLLHSLFSNMHNRIIDSQNKSDTFVSYGSKASSPGAKRAGDPTSLGWNHIHQIDAFDELIAALVLK